MFENLTDKFERAFKVLKGQGQITEINVAETLKEVRRALLDADVSFNTAKHFTNIVKEKALGRDVLNAVSPGQLMIKICHEELIELMGGNEVEINLNGAPAIILMSGLQGSGKTTLLNSLQSSCEKQQRILIIEDSRELNPQHPHVVSLEGRPANIEGMGLITMKDLIKQSLRMRADRLIIGEVRGGEVIDWLGALNTGHIGSAGTIHANSIHEVIIRFESLGLMAGLSKEAIHSQLRTALDYVIQIERNTDGKRKVNAIGQFETDSNGNSFIKQLPI